MKTNCIKLYRTIDSEICSILVFQKRVSDFSEKGLGRSAIHEDKVLEDKVIDIFSQLNITISKSDIEYCHRLGKANPKNAIV